MLFKIIFICVLLNYTSAQAPLNKEYKYETYFKANWYDAYQFCRDHGMQLATINTDNEQIAIQQAPPSKVYGEYENYWISATDMAEDGVYKWFSTGKAMAFTYWDMGQPIELNQSPYEPKIDNIEDCVQIVGNGHRWATTNCSTLNYFICETL